MRKLFFIAAVALCSRAAMAQVTAGPEAGVQMTNVSIDGGGGGSRMKAGLRAGINLDAQLIRGMHLQFAALYSVKGYKYSYYSGWASRTEATTSISYIEVPVYLNYMSGDKGDNRFFIGGGPYLAMAVGGFTKGSSGKTRIGIGSNGTVKTWDAGLNLNVGVLLSAGVFFRAHYSLGLADITPDREGWFEDKSKATNNGFGITIGLSL